MYRIAGSRRTVVVLSRGMPNAFMSRARRSIFEGEANRRTRVADKGSSGAYNKLAETEAVGGLSIRRAEFDHCWKTAGVCCVLGRARHSVRASE